jgi:Xaa-Pro dipeptidase
LQYLPDQEVAVRVTVAGEAASTNVQLPKWTFPLEEFTTRVQRTREELVQRGLDAGLFFSGEAIYYLAGYDGLTHHDSQTLVVPLDREPFVVIRQHLAPGFQRASWVSRLFTYRDQADPVEVLKRAMTEQCLARARLGLEETAFPLSVTMARAIGEALPKASIGDCSGIVERLRLVKSEREIAYVREAAGYADIGMDTASEMVKAGVSEQEIAAEIYRRMIGAGSEHPAIPVLVGIEERTHLAMPLATPRRVGPREVLWVEVFGISRRYTAGLKSTFGVRPVGRERETRWKTVQDALQRGISAAIPGRSASDVAGAVQETFRAAGYGEFSYHQSGYSVGVTFSPHPHEARMLGLKTGNVTPLQDGMTLHVIANLYGDAPAICASHTILVTKAGPEVLTRYQHSPDLFR